MRKSTLALASAALAWPLAVSANPAAPAPDPAADATKFVTSVIDKFNSGDVKAWVAAQADNTTIVDEFAPFIWTGARSAQRWLGDYGKVSQANSITSPRVDYGKPLQASSDGQTAYVVLPTTYRFTANGKRMAEPSSLTFVMDRNGKDWRITSWTYSAKAAPAADK